MAAGQGTFLVSGHFGQWEAVRGLLRRNGMETGGIYRPLKNPYLNEDYTACLEAGGRPMVDRGAAGLREMIRHVRRGGLMSVLMDQYTKRGVEIDFLGHPAPSGTMIAELAVKFGVPMIPVYATRQEDGTIRVEFEAPLARGTALEMTQAAADSLSARVRATPGQWFWLHRRWVKVFPGQEPER
jgi:KDO2-lipid IV(A) lauroyltransferase